MAAAGWKVAVADYRPFGGTCALRGCDPKKVLVGAIQTIDDVRRMTGRGVVAPEAHIAWRELIAFKRGFTVPVPAKQERQYGDKKIAMHHGAVRFASRNTLEVEGNVVEARHVLIATGAKAAPLPRPEIPLEESERP